MTGSRRLRWIQVATGPLFAGAVVLVVSSPVRAQGRAGETHQAAQSSFAQRLVQKALAAHPETDEIGVAAVGPRGCTVVGSTDTSDVGEPSEEDDAAPIKTGKASVGKEGGEFDVSVPLHDQTGRLVGALTTRFKKAAGQTGASLTTLATSIADEMAKQIPSKAALLGR